MTAAQVMRWVAEHPLIPIQIDCTNTVMLKILHGKCKMHGREKAVMTAFYDALKTRLGVLFDNQLHALIATARQHLDDRGRAAIYERRALNDEGLFRGASVVAAMSSDRP